MHTHCNPKTICLGLDIAKAKLDACLLHNGQRHRARFDNTAPGLRALLAWLRPLHDGPPAVVMESSGAR